MHAGAVYRAWLMGAPLPAMLGTWCGQGGLAGICEGATAAVMCGRATSLSPCHHGMEGPLLMCRQQL